jgi:hypothetical protein
VHDSSKWEPTWANDASSDWADHAACYEPNALPNVCDAYNRWGKLMNLAGIIYLSLFFFLIPFTIVAVIISTISSRTEEPYKPNDSDTNTVPYLIGYSVIIIITALVNKQLMSSEGFGGLAAITFIAPVLAGVVTSLLSMRLWKRGFNGTRVIAWVGAIIMYFIPLCVLIVRNNNLL